MMTEDIDNALKVLRAGGVILYPTDTIWGLGCDAENAEAVTKEKKGRPAPAKKAAPAKDNGKKTPPKREKEIYFMW